MSAVSDPSASQNEKPVPQTPAPMQRKPGLLDKLWSVPARLDVRRTWAALFFIVAVILFLRQPGAVSHPGFYAEDGKIFFKQQYEMGFLPALLTYYAGYLHFAPRVIAAICGFLPLECAPAAYAIASLLIAAAALTFFFAPGFRAVIDSDPLRALVVISFTLMPNTEPLMKLAYANWYMLLFIALATLFTLPQRPVARWLFFVPVAVAAWSTPVAIVCLPLILLRAWDAADRMERLWWVALALAVVGFSLSAERPPSVITMLLREQDWKIAAIHAIGYRVFCFFFFGETLCYPFPSEGWTVVTGFSLPLLGICAGGAVLATANPQYSRSSRRVPLALLYLILGLSAMFVLRREWLKFFFNWNADSWRPSGRYFFCSTLLLCVFSGVIYERVLRRWVIAKTGRRELATLLLLCWLCLHAFSFRLFDWRTQTSWRHYAGQIHAAEARVRQNGGAEFVHVRTRVVDFDFDLLVSPASVKRDHAAGSPN